MYKKLLLAGLLLVGATRGCETQRGFFDIVGAVADAIYENEYDSAVYDVDSLWRQTTNNCAYLSVQFPYYYQYQLAEINELFRLISYEWIPFIDEFERYHGLSLDQVNYLANCLVDLNYAMNRVIHRRYYDAELSMISQVLRGLWYEMERPATHPFAIVHCAQWVNEVTNIIAHM